MNGNAPPPSKDQPAAGEAGASADGHGSFEEVVPSTVSPLAFAPPRSVLTAMPPAPTRRTGRDVLDVTQAWDAKRAIDMVGARELAPQLMKAGVQRLALISLVTGSVALVGAAGVLAVRAPVGTGAVAPLVLLAAGSLAVFVMTRLGTVRAQVVMGSGHAYLVFGALQLAFLRHAQGWPSGVPWSADWSPVAVWMLLYAALIPVTPRTLAALLGLCIGADALALYMLRVSVPVPAEPARYLFIAGSTVLGAALAMLASQAIHDLSPALAVERTIGSYKLLSQLGVGGMAEVWLARHQLLVRPAAVKLIRPKVLASGGPAESLRLARLFEREAQATAGLQSPHTIQVYDFGVTRDGAFYYVMELLDGYDLQTLVERFGRQPQERVAHIIRQVCHSLYEAHSNDFVHRDIKPSNIFTCRYARDYDFAKVLDFGLVKDQRPTIEELEDEKRLVGTPSVMAPEMLRFGAPLDARADLYSLGCVMYWMLTGMRVFEAETRNDMLVMHAHQRPVLPSKRAKIEVEPALEAILMACLQKNPDRRPASARAVAQALEQIRFATPWTHERAREWWVEHGPKTAPGGDGAALPANASAP